MLDDVFSVMVGIDSAFLWGILFLSISAFVILGLVLKFHWKKYNTNNAVSKKANFVFWFVAFVLITAAAFALLIFESGI